MKRLILILCLCSVSLSAQAINWVDISGTYALPTGVKLYAGTRVSPALSAWYLDVDMNVSTVAVRPYLTGTPANVATLSPQFGAIASVNGGVFGGTSSYASVVYPFEVKAQNVQTVTRNSQPYPVIRSFFGVDKNRNMRVQWVYHFDATVGGVRTFSAPLPYVWNDATPQSAPVVSQGSVYQDLLVGIGGAPTLVKSGAVHITLNEEIIWGSGIANDTAGQDPRTALGYTASKHCIIFACDGRNVNGSQGLGLGELARVLIGLGCVEAVNLDGGGSTQMAVGSTAVNGQSSRAVPSIFSVVVADSLNLPKTPTFEKIIDNGDAACTLTGSWTTTSNTGYYGTTPSNITLTGDGSKYATYHFVLPKLTQYTVYGWWVASSNRCTGTPYIITHNHVQDTVRADQTTNGSQWVQIGTYTFAGDGTDSVVVSNKSAQSGAYVVVDAVRLVSYDPTITGVTQGPDVPIGYALGQNYPNPFNPVTGIRYQVPGVSGQSSVVSLKVYDLLGREVSTLVNGVKNPGTYEVRFNGAGLASGVYLYRLQAGSYVETKKLVLLK